MSTKSRITELNKDINVKKQKIPRSKAEKPIEANIPRGQRADFLKITSTMPGDMLVALKTIGMKRKAEGQKDCDTSALIREALLEWINKDLKN
jgi:hypothetical protein